MAVYTDIHQLPRFENTILTVGFFDGVHKGHETILQEVVRHAQRAGGESVLLTFEPHPRKFLFPDQPLGIITPLHKKLQLITEAGIQHIVVVPFTRDFSNLTAHEYITQFMIGRFHPRSIVIGYDHRFGHDRKGNLQLLEDYAGTHNYTVIEIPAQLIDEAAVSSTKIRTAISEGRMEDASHMLGRQYSIEGKVVHGNKLGRTIGYPTANIVPNETEQIIPALGIYAVTARHGATMYGGMLSIGYNPTVTDEKILRIEANLFNFDSDIYGEDLEIFFVKKLRDEQKFESLEELKKQLHRDREDSLEALSA